MKYSNLIRAAAFVAIALSSVAFAQWTLTWYVDPDNGSVGSVTDGVTPLAQGLPVFLLWAGPDATPNGLLADGTIQGDDQLIVLQGGGNAGVTVGLQDYPWNAQGAGEFYQVSSMQDAFLNSTMYAIAFSVPVAYSAGRFYGSGFWGNSAGFLTNGDPNQYATMNGWSVTNAMIPEPGTIALLGAGLAGILAYRRKRLATAG